MNKTPYEIRLELLQLATTILINRTVYNDGNELVNYEPTSEEVMEEAIKLNMFVTDSCSVCKTCEHNPCEC